MKDQLGWLLERNHNGATQYIGVIDGLLGWTLDPGKALRLARREDGDALATICKDAESVFEHMWCYPVDPFSKGYKHRDGDPVSDACGDGKHAECAQDFTKCGCTFRSGHTTMHAYCNALDFKKVIDEDPRSQK